MPRKSQALQDMETVGLLAKPRDAGPVPIPDVLTDKRTRELFASIYKANPSAHLYTEALEPVLTQYCRHIRASEQVAELIKGIDQTKEPRLFLSLLRAQRDESAAIASLATKLRFSASSLADKRRVAMPNAEKPWL